MIKINLIDNNKKLNTNRGLTMARQLIERKEIHTTLKK